MYCIEYVARLKGVNQLLRLLVDNELHRLLVWDNPVNDAKRGVDTYGSADRGLLDVCPSKLIDDLDIC